MENGSDREFFNTPSCVVAIPPFFFPATPVQFVKMASHEKVDSSWSRETVYFVLATLLVLAILIITLIQRWQSRRQPSTVAHEEESTVRRRMPDPVTREDLPTGARHRQARRRMQIERDSDEETPVASQRHEDDDDDEEEDIYDKIAMPEGKVGTKKLRKLQEKAEKRAMREQLEREREEKKEQAAALEEKRKKDEERQKIEEAAREEEERKRKEEEEQREHEEYLKLKEEFTIDEEGEQEENTDLNSESLLNQFINYIKELKVVMLEDLAIHFKIKTQDTIDRINTLLNEGKLTGVMDDRGKFIYITREEMEAIAKYIRQRGRISVSDLAKSSNTLINLNPDNELAQRRLLTAAAAFFPFQK
ncbi:DDRGK1 [Acanthosepion pharaonis]|uniref:DDRGK domain-containing protein 1 n=1 Tax=Acanthosepion pharaonis TaxID=158019 RepID=A0A812E9Z9_ACAPH|nr:DDRGK1 [Sepia pharaonis]